MDRFGTKDTYERESDEAERLVRPAPKIKPPRLDKRRETVFTDRDNDTNDDPDLKGDPDMSLNYKTIGGSMTHRVLERWASGKKSKKKKVKVKNKKTDWVGWVSPDTVKAKPADFEVVKKEEDVPETSDESGEIPADKGKPGLSLAPSEDDKMDEWGWGPKEKELATSLGLTGGSKYLDGDTQKLVEALAKMPAEGFTEADLRKLAPKVDVRHDLGPKLSKLFDVERDGKENRWRPKGEPKKTKDEKPVAPEAQKGEASTAEADAQAQSSLQGMAKSDAEFAAILKDFTNPKSDMFTLARSAPETSAAKFLRGRTPPKGVKTLGDLQRVLLLKVPKTKSPVPAAPEPKAPAAVAPEPAAVAPEPKAPAAAPDLGSWDPAPAAPESKAPEAPEPEEKPPAVQSFAVGEGRPKRLVTEREGKEADDELYKTLVTSAKFPNSKMYAFLVAQNLHPDETNSFIADYKAAAVAKASPAIAESASKFYQTDPSKVPDPVKVKNEQGVSVNFKDLPKEQQAVERRKHQIKTVAMSVASHHVLTTDLVNQGAPEALASQLAEFSITVPKNESPEARADRASKLSEALFESTLKSGKAKPISLSVMDSLLKSVDKDPAAKKVIVGYLQASDYIQARKKYLNQNSADHISDHQDPAQIARGLIKASNFLRNQATLYPGLAEMREGLTSQDVSLIFRKRVLRLMSTLAPAKMPEIQNLLDKDDNKQYEASVARYEKSQAKFEARKTKSFDELTALLEKEKDNPKFVATQLGDILAKKGIFEPKKPEKPPRYDLLKLTPEQREAEASRMWDDFASQNEDLDTDEGRKVQASRVVIRSLFSPFSTYRNTFAMVSDRKAVYWGVEPNAVGPYPGWEQAQARDLGEADYSRLLKAAKDWLRVPVLSTSVDGIVRDTQLRAALDLAINHEGSGRYSSGLHPTVYNNLLAKLAGVSTSETLLTIRTAQEKQDMTIKLASQEADNILGRLDRVASTIQQNHEQWGMPFSAAKELVNEIDKMADEIEVASFGHESILNRQVEIIGKTAQVIQRDSDEKFMDTFRNPQKPIQTEANEPYMKAYDSDDSSDVRNGKSTTGRALAP
jgi:hypothetical protein